MENLTGKKLGPYELRQQIGVRGTSAVYRAYNPSLRREVAVKVVTLPQADSKDFTTRFEKEARIVAALSYPNIVPLFDFGVQGNIFFLVSRLLVGSSLANRLKPDNTSRADSLPLSDTAKIVEQIASALDYAHKQGIVHGDVKPSNVFLDSQNNALLTGFGLSDFLVLHSKETGMTIGTPAYMSPEQGLRKPVSAASDQYSLGVMTYQMVTGRVPFEGESLIEVADAHLSYPLPSPETLRPSLSIGVKPVLERAMAAKPDQRFPTALAFSQAFTAAIGAKSQPVSAPPPGAAAPKSPPAVVSRPAKADPAAQSMQPAPAPVVGGPLKVFISYRRDDSADVSGRIYDRLVNELKQENIFMDVDNIPPGVDFVDYLDNAVKQCTVLLALIGPQWVGIKDKRGRRRLDDPNDFVRIEIESALRRNILVIPVLVRGANMPSAKELPGSLQPLTRRNATQVRHDPDFHNDMTRLIKALK